MHTLKKKKNQKKPKHHPLEVFEYKSFKMKPCFGLLVYKFKITLSFYSQTVSEAR